MSALSVSPEDHADPIASLSRAAAQAGTSTIGMVVDPVLGDPFEPELLPMQRRLRFQVSGIAAAQTPYVVLFDAEQAADLKLLQMSADRALDEAAGEHDTEQGSPRTVAGYLIAQGSQWSTCPEQLALTQGLSALSAWPRMPQVAFRYWDPRITSELGWVFRAATWAGPLRALGVAQWWCAGQHAKRLYAALAQEPALHYGLSPAALSAWPADAEAERRLSVITWSNRVVQLAKRWHASERLSVAVARPVVERAMGLGLQCEDDVVRFVHGALTLHPSLEKHPYVLAALRDTASSGDGAFARAMRQMDDEMIDALRAGHWMAEPL